MEACSSVTHSTNCELTDERRKLLCTNSTVKSYVESRAHPDDGDNVVNNSSWGNAIEPVIFFYLMAQALSEAVITNLLENRTCQFQLRLPDRNCTEPISASIEDLIQPSTADVIMARSLVEALVPSVLTLFVGPWSDTNGRKPFLVVALVGQTVSYLTWGCLALLHGIRPFMFLLASVPISFSGGSSVVFLLIYCYLTDITDDQTRPFRLSLLTLAIFTSSIVGIAFAPVIVTAQKTLNPYPLVFFISTVLLALTVVYTVCCIYETVHVQTVRTTRFFELSHLKRVCLVCFSRRDGQARYMIQTIISCIALNVIIAQGQGAVLYLSAQEMFSWSLDDYTIYNCVNCIIYGPGTVVGVWLFTSALHLTNVQGAAVSLASGLAGSPIMAMATASWHFYLANFVGILSSAYDPLLRSELGRLASSEDHGKIFALTAFLESISPVVATPLYTAVYEATYLHSPGSVYWLSSGITVTAVLMLVSVVITQKLVEGACYINTMGTSGYVSI